MRIISLLLAVVALVADHSLAQETRSARSRDGIEIRFDVWGRDQAAAAYVLVHGWSNNRSYWAPHVSRLSARRPVVTVDLPGFGESGSRRAEWTMEAYGSDIAAVVAELGLERVMLVGFSMGAAVVLEASLQIPDRVVGVVLVDWLQDPTARYTDSFIRDFADEVRSRWREPAWVREVGFNAASPDSLIAQYIASHPPSPPDHWMAIFEQTLRWADQQLLPTLRRTTVPVAAINSDLVPTNVAGYREILPTFELRTMPGLGHIGVIWEQTALFAQHLEELTEVMVRRP